MKKEPIPLSGALVLMIVGLWMSIVFTLSPFYWNVRAELSACPKIETTFQSVEIFSRRSQTEAAVNCSNGNRYFTDSIATSDALLAELSQLEPGAPLELRIHPNSHRLLEIRANGRELLNFDWAMARVERNGKAFFVLAWFMYAATITGIVNLVWHFVRKIQHSR